MAESSLGGHWMFGLSARHVRDVIVGGDVVVRDHRVTTVDQDKVFADASAVAERLFTRMQQIPPHPFEPAGVS